MSVCLSNRLNLLYILVCLSKVCPHFKPFHVLGPPRFDPDPSLVSDVELASAQAVVGFEFESACDGVLFRLFRHH